MKINGYGWARGLAIGVLALVLQACGRAQFVPQDGDIVFCVGGTSAMSEAIVDATQGATQYDHVALFAYVDGAPAVIEAAPKHGVVVTPWAEFLADATPVNGRPGIVVMRLLSPDGPDRPRPDISEAVAVDAATIVNRARTFLGQPYDWSYLPDNGKLYCSELIYECYRRTDGQPVFSAQPMRFRDADGNLPQFWVDLFAKLGETVPEGVPGTNPNDLSQDPQLVQVHRYF
ncbi:MAG: hypothetical protein J6U70_00530 [Bacteroidales bacterium]|nr:hypothetical protein [Bacteroidales bacterium]